MPAGLYHRQDGEARLIACDILSGPDGVCTDVLTWLEGPEVYRVHLGGALPTAAQRDGSLEVNIPRDLLERLCWHVAIALEHSDARRADEAAA